MEATEILAEETLGARERVTAAQKARDATLEQLEGATGDRHDFLLRVLGAKEDDIDRAHAAQTTIYRALSLTPQTMIVATDAEDDGDVHASIPLQPVPVAIDADALFHNILVEFHRGEPAPATLVDSLKKLAVHIECGGDYLSVVQEYQDEGAWEQFYVRDPHA